MPMLHVLVVFIVVCFHSSFAVFDSTFGAGIMATLDALVVMLDSLGCKEAVDIVKEVLGM